MNAAFRHVLFSAMIAATCSAAAGAETPDHRDATARAPQAAMTAPLPAIPAALYAGAADEGPDIGLDGGGPPGPECRPIYSLESVAVGTPTGDAEKDSIGRVVERVDCDRPR